MNWTLYTEALNKFPLTAEFCRQLIKWGQIGNKYNDRINAEKRRKHKTPPTDEEILAERMQDILDQASWGRHETEEWDLPIGVIKTLKENGFQVTTDEDGCTTISW